MIEQPERIDVAEWAAAFAGLHGAGLDWFDFLGVIDRGDGVDVAARVMSTTTGATRFLITRVESSVSSLSSVYPGAGWYEREAGEMFGIQFDGLVDKRPLLRRLTAGLPPMRKGTALPGKGAAGGAAT